MTDFDEQQANQPQPKGTTMSDTKSVSYSIAGISATFSLGDKVRTTAGARQEGVITRLTDDGVCDITDSYGLYHPVQITALEHV